MRVKVDKDCDAIFIRLNDAEIVSSEENQHGFIIDFDKNDSIVGFEILNVKQKFYPKKMDTFSQRLGSAIKEKGNAVCVGLDPRYEQLPKVFQTASSPEDFAEIAATYKKFCCAVIDIVAPLVPVVKPQAAFFEQIGPFGMFALESVIRHARSKGLLVIFDGKRNDIGSTAFAYANGILGKAWHSDALTVNPYLGDDSLMPFLDAAKTENAGVFVLVKTSNPGGEMLQDLLVNEKRIYSHVADWVEKQAAETASENGYGIVGAVVGATWPEQLAQLRKAMPHAWLLVPGYGSQGGTASDVAPAFDENGLGAIINNSRGILYPKSDGQNWEKAIENATRSMIQQLGEFQCTSRN